MNIIKYFSKRFLSLFKYPNISEDILSEIKGPILLHISDTPVDIYHDIFRIIDILKPNYIIHTGDLADNIKLEIQKNRIESYYNGVKKLIDGLEKNDAIVYYILGNHDDYETVNKLIKRGKILDEGLLTIDDCNIIVGHYHKEYSYDTDFNLYGHSFEPKHYKINGTIGLNGVLNINIIDLSNKGVFQLKYPIGTNRFRGMELRKIGF